MKTNNKNKSFDIDHLHSCLQEAEIRASQSQLTALWEALSKEAEGLQASSLPETPRMIADIEEALRRIDLSAPGLLRALEIEHRPYVGEFRIRCPGCGHFSLPYKAGATTATCIETAGCGEGYSIAEMIQAEAAEGKSSPEKLGRLSMSLSELSGIPVLGYRPLNNGFTHDDSRLPLIVRLCRYEAGENQFALKMAASDFGLSPSTMESARLGFYPSSDCISERLNGFGVRDLLSMQMEMLSDLLCDVSNETHSMTNLVVCFLKSQSGTIPSVWGYRPAAMRRKGERGEQYVVGRSWHPGSLYLIDILGDEPAVLVDGFMHALALRQAGFNAVAAPFISLLDYTIWRYLADRGHTRIIAGMTRDNKSEMRLAEMNALRAGVTLDWLTPTSCHDRLIQLVAEKIR